MDTPIIRIEVEHMRHVMVSAFKERMLKMDSLFQQAITAACRPDVIQGIIEDAAERYLKQALEEEVKSFLLYGDGRKLVREEVKKRLESDFI